MNLQFAHQSRKKDDFNFKQLVLGYIGRKSSKKWLMIQLFTSQGIYIHLLVGTFPEVRILSNFFQIIADGFIACSGCLCIFLSFLDCFFVFKTFAERYCILQNFAEEFRGANAFEVNRKIMKIFSDNVPGIVQKSVGARVIELS